MNDTVLPDGVSERSTNPLDYQDLPQPIVAMAKTFPDGFVTPLHEHRRDQLLYATSGVMRLRTQWEAWIVPPDGAVYIPAETTHTVAMHGHVDMRTLYIDPQAVWKNPQSLTVIAVPELLKELVLALTEEPAAYDNNRRGSLLTLMIKCEIERARAISLHVHLPRDPRLRKLCAGLLADPSDRRNLEDWSDVCGASPRTLERHGFF